MSKTRVYQYLATLTRVVDGDTFDLEADLGFGLTKRIRARLMRVDCAEYNQDREKAIAARDFVQAWFDDRGGTYSIKTVKKDSFGRWLVDIPSLADELVLQGHARRYE